MIRVRGARQNNLRGVDIDIERAQLVAVVGPSGSGKTSLVFDTIHAESQRRYLDVLSMHESGLGRGLRRPDVDAISGLPPSVALDQAYRRPSARTTVSAYADVHAVLQVLFGRCGEQRCPMCGDPIVPQSHDEIVAELLAIPTGTRMTVEAPLTGEPGRILDEVVRAGFSRVRVGGEVRRLEEVDPRTVEGPIRVVVDRLKARPDRAGRLHDAVRLASRAGKGALVVVAGDQTRSFVDRPVCLRDGVSFPSLTPAVFRLGGVGCCETCDGLGRVADERCTSCDGLRFNAVTRAVRVGELTIGDSLRWPVRDLRTWVQAAERGPVSTPILDALEERLRQLESLGLGGIELGRPGSALSTGEVQRLRLSRQLTAGLSGVAYCLDEPTAGLGAAETGPVIALLRTLVDQGNTVVCVTHTREVLEACDRVIEFGPGAGTAGGSVVFDGPPSALVKSGTSTGVWLAGEGEATHRRCPESRGDVGIADGLGHLPAGTLGVITGPSGSGKSVALRKVAEIVSDPSRVLTGLAEVQRLVRVEDMTGRMHRSNPATYMGVWSILRTLMAATTEAQVRGIQAGQFSLNQAGGRCEPCGGMGEQRVDLGVLTDVYRTCPVCDGQRFTADMLEVRWRGHNPAELLALSAEEARGLLAGHPKLERALRALVDVGLGYVPLGQAARTLSGGETHRLRLARELARARRSDGMDTLVLLDDPSRGLHPQDTAGLLRVLIDLAHTGATVWVATQDSMILDAAASVLRLQPRSV